MNKVDKKLYNQLIFYSENNVGDIKELKKNNPSLYPANQSDENTLHKIGYINFGKDNNVYAITFEGLEMLRVLEKAKLDYIAINISKIALFLSIVAFIKSMGWV